MEKRQGFFSALKEEVVRGLSPARSRARSPARSATPIAGLLRRRGSKNSSGPVRPLRRALQGLDPRTTASMFANARCIGEKKVNGQDCFILKLCADPQTLKARSEGPAEIIRHVLFGYFSQRTGLLVHMEDSHLTRIQSSTGGDAIY